MRPLYAKINAIVFLLNLLLRRFDFIEDGVKFWWFTGPESKFFSHHETVLMKHKYSSLFITW